MSFTIANAKRNTLSSEEKSNKYAVNDYSVDLNNENDSHAIIVKHALGSKRILDLGCGVGYIGQAIKKNQDCIVDGIDIDESALKIAKKFYNQVFLIKLDQTNSAFQSFLKDKQTYDCIICADIIEHLVDPGYIIAILTKKLTPNGKILVSIPNIAHIDVIANLIDNKFNYGETGILDNTHLRFWTESSFYEFIENINKRYKTSLNPKLIKRTFIVPPTIDTHYLHEICGDEIFTFQNIFELKNEKNPQIPHPKNNDNYQKIINLIDENARLKSELAEIKKINHGIETSLSWKITKPLRKINAIFHKH